MFARGIDRHARAEVAARVMLQDIGGSLGRIEAHSLDVPFDVDIFLRPDMPAHRPIDGKIIPHVDIVVYDHRNFAETGTL